MKKAKTRVIELKVSGNGWATIQYPQAGTQLGEDRVCNVTFELSN